VRHGQHCRKIYAAATVAFLVSVSHGNADCTSVTNTTFDSRTGSYAELTNSFHQVKARLEVAQKTLGNSNTNVANLLSELAGLYDDLGDYAQAVSLDQRCREIREELLDTNNMEVAMEVADIWNDLAWEYQQMGDYESALPLFKQSLDLTEKSKGRENCDFATTLSSIADLYRLKGDYAKALPMCQSALAIRQRVLGQDHPDVTDSLLTLAEIYRGLGDFPMALATCQRSIHIAEKRLGPGDPLIADHLFLLGKIQRDLGDYEEALPAFRRALAMDEKISGPENPDTLDVLDELAVLYGKRLDLEQCLAATAELFDRQRHYFVGQALATSDSIALRTIQTSFQFTEFFHSVCAEASAKKLRAADAFGAAELALGKAFLEEVRATQAAFDCDPQTGTKELRRQYGIVQSQLGRLPKSKLKSAQRDSRREEMENELDALETQLADRVGLVAQAVRERNLTLTDIARNLPQQTALVDFIEYHSFDLSSKTNCWGEQRYAAYLTFPLTTTSTDILVERVDLGQAAPINDFVAVVCKRMSAGQFAAKDLAAALRRLSELVYTPLAGHLKGVSHIIVCPDAQLSRVPFEMLPTGDGFLVEQKMVSYVTSGREIVRLAQHAGLPPSDRSEKSLVMGNPDFDLELSKASRANLQSTGFALPVGGTLRAIQDEAPVYGESPTRAAAVGIYQGLKFKPLPGSEAEARSVAKLIGDNCILRLGADAREAELKTVRSPRVLHLATHGFFLSDHEVNNTNGLSKSLLLPSLVDFAGRGSLITMRQDWKNPLLRCGIALAGANHAAQVTNAVGENGLLTGMEASLLNLQGTELVILSACESGTGEVEIGEGVMSLRRAFRIAGAQTVLASHWNVSDKATTKLMTEFMRRWQSGEPRVKAWREAQLELLRSKGTTDDYSNPYFWAAFTLTGQWR
jgi:CHAT domain-containing protein/tetratricopeptide (TPR) repeat protein